MNFVNGSMYSFRSWRFDDNHKIDQPDGEVNGHHIVDLQHPPNKRVYVFDRFSRYLNECANVPGGGEFV